MKILKNYNLDYLPRSSSDTEKTMIECRGKNGWFNLAKATSFDFLNTTKPPEEGTVAIEISSKRPYKDMPPIYLQGPRNEMITLLQDLLNQVETLPQV
jgi:hypothetical protein